MEPIEIVAIVVCAVIVLGVLISAIIRRVKGKKGCDCAGKKPDKRKSK